RPRLALSESLRLGGVEAARGLYQRVEPAPARPRAFVAIGAKRDVNDTGPDARDLLGSEAERSDGARSVALHKHVGVPQQRGERLAPASLTQVDIGRQLSPPGIDDERLERR